MTPHPGQQRFSRDVLAGLSEADREIRLRELEALSNRELQSHDGLAEFQTRLYALIDQLSSIGHDLGRWDYGSEIEIWGGRSYMDASIEDELLLRSEFPLGIRLAWRDYKSLERPGD